MKPIILSLLITLLIPAFIIGQSFDAWSEPAPISDSIADNNNPFLLRIEYPMKLMMAWEKSADSSSSAIYMDNIIDEIPGNQILSDPGIKYKHPHLLHLDSYPSSDTLFFLFYADPGCCWAATYVLFLPGFHNRAIKS